MKKLINITPIHGADDLLSITISYKLDCYLLTGWVILFGHGICIDIWRLHENN